MINAKIFGIIALALLFAGCSLTGQTVKETPYKIAVITPLTGDGSNLGQPFANGMQMAVSEINSNGGINGRQLELFAEDGRFSSKDSLDAANYLEANVNPDIYSVIFYLPANSISPFLANTKKPMVYEAYSQDLLSQNPYTFKANFDSQDGCEKMVKYLKEAGKYRKLGVVFAQSAYSSECLAGVKKIEPNVSEYWYTFGNTDFRTILAKARNDGVDRVMFEGIEFEYVALFKQLSEGDYGIKVACATTSECMTSAVRKSATVDALNDTVSIDFISQDITRSAFAKEYMKEYPKAAFADIAYGAVGYEEVMYMSKAMGSCKPGESECLMNSLENVKNYTSVIGSNGFKDRVLQLTTTVYDYNGSDWVTS